MIVVYINPTGVEKVFFSADSDRVEDSCLAAIAWRQRTRLRSFFRPST
jgi:hypothetical protein